MSDENQSQRPVTRLSARTLGGQLSFRHDPEAGFKQLQQEMERSGQLENQIRELERNLHQARRQQRKHAKSASTQQATVERLRQEVSRLKSARWHRIAQGYWNLTRHVKNPKNLLISLRGQLNPKTREATQGRNTGRSAGANQVTEDTGSKELWEIVQDRPKPGNISKLLNRAYFREGQVLLPVEVANRFPEEVESLGNQEKHIVRMSRGWLPVVSDDVYIPPRSPGQAYHPEENSILYCANSTGEFESNGYSIRTDSLTRALTERELKVTVAARVGYPWDVKSVANSLPDSSRVQRSWRGIDVVYNNAASVQKTPFTAYVQASADAYVREALRVRAAVIHAASNYLTALPALIAARRLGIPFVYEVRGLWELSEASEKPGFDQSDRFRISRRLENQVIREADHVFAINQQVSNRIAADTGIQSVSLLTNSVDVGTYRPAEQNNQLKSDLGIAADDIVVGYAGSIVEYEGLDDLIHAFDRVSATRENLHLVIVGDGKYLAELQDIAARVHHSERVHFVGRVPNDEVREYLSIFDYVACLRKRREVTELVTPLKPLEAMASGVTVIGSDLPPIRDLLIGADGEVRGILVEPEDITAIEQVLNSLVRGQRVPESALASRARLWVKAERSWQKLAEEASRYYIQLRAELEHRDARPLAEIKLAVIADEFTASTLAGSADVVELTPENWRRDLEARDVDALFVESAWEGLEGSWRRKVGYYGDAEAEDLHQLIDYCRLRRIPTIFWNKEDPVHTQRFLPTSRLFDHVFTTDANCIELYLDAQLDSMKTVASAAFFATPTLHNPMPLSKERDPRAVFAGTYYGDRFKDRKKDLDNLLDAAEATTGLVIFDRQYDLQDSPYRFPQRLEPFIRGSATYREMLDIYKSFAVQLNVNSVANSPTMFSRRVVEAAASGTNVISGSGSGVELTLGGKVPVVNSEGEANDILNAWVQYPAVMLRDAWEGLREVASRHLAENRLAMMLRSAGIEVGISSRPRVIFRNDPGSEVPRNEVAVHAESDPQEASRTSLIALAGPTDVTFDELLAEDICLIHMLTKLDNFTVTLHGMEMQSVGISEFIPGSDGAEPNKVGVMFHRPALQPIFVDEPEKRTPLTITTSPTVLIAGHDLKFLGDLPQYLRDQGHHVLIDQWHDHTKHDADESSRLLRESDLIFCEWALGNLEWYSREVRAGQRLSARFHLQELQRPYLDRADKERIDQLIFVANQVRFEAKRKFDIDEIESVVISNVVNVSQLLKPKLPGAHKTIGFVGMVPQRKRLDRALDVLAEVRNQDPEFSLRIKGKTHLDYPWLADRPLELAYFESQLSRINEAPELRGAVHFDPQGNDMASWYQSIGFAISVSDFESFHYTLSDGAASLAVPLTLLWPGADEMFPRDWVVGSTEEMAAQIVSLSRSEAERAERSRSAADFVDAHSSSSVVLPQLFEAITGNSLNTSE